MNAVHQPQSQAGELFVNRIAGSPQLCGDFFDRVLSVIAIQDELSVLAFQFLDAVFECLFLPIGFRKRVCLVLCDQ